MNVRREHRPRLVRLIAYIQPHNNRASDNRIWRVVGEYETYLKSDTWRRKRDLLFAQSAVSRCYGCGRQRSDRRPFDAHHVTYQRFGNEDIGDLVTMCRICHDLVHQLIGAGFTIGDATDEVRNTSIINRQPKPATALKKHPRYPGSKARLAAARRAIRAR
jgi:hypothetical protein